MNRATSRAVGSKVVAWINPTNKINIFKPTGRSLKTPEVGNKTRSVTIDTKEFHISTVNTSKCMVVANNIHQYVSVIDDNTTDNTRVNPISTQINPTYKRVTFAPTGRPLRTPEVGNKIRSITFDTKATKTTTGHTSHRMEVVNNLHRDDAVTAESNGHVDNDPITEQTVPIRDSTTYAPTERSLKTPAVDNNNRASLIKDDSVIKAIVTTCRLYYKPDTQPTIDNVRQILTDAYKSTDENYGAEEAIEWANGFEIPSSTVTSDMNKFRAAGLDFKVMVKRQISLNAANRLSKERIDKLLPNNPEKDKLYDLSNGMVIPQCPSFVPNALGETTPPRELYLKVHSAVDKMLYTLHQQGLAFILPEKEALQHIPNLNCCKAHWARKKGKKSGRPIGDLSNGDGTPLNSEYAKLEAEKRWGVIHHPTISGFIIMIFDLYEEMIKEDPTATWDDLVIWTMDLAGAYTLLSFRPDNANLMGMVLSNNRVFIFLCGVFGWTCTPAAFQVVTRALTFEMNEKLIGKVQIYVDDIMGVCRRKDLQHDMDTARSICTSLLGPNSVAEDKSKSGRRLDLIGYVVDLDTKSLSIARKNFLNTVYGFYTVDAEGNTTLPEAQRLASLASRYSVIFRHMRPFSSALHQATCGRSNKLIKFKFQPEAQRSIRMWRATLALVELNEAQFSRPLDSFRPQVVKYIVEFDASLTGIGLLWYRRDKDNNEISLGAAAVDLQWLKFGADSSFQNVAEYIGGLIGLVGLIKLGINNVAVEFRGDSLTALSWAKKEKSKGKLVSNAAIVFSLLCIRFGLNVQDTTHISGEENWRCDALSRLSQGRSTFIETLLTIGRSDTKVINLDDSNSSSTLLRCCDPRLSLDEEEEFLSFWTDIQNSLNELSTSHSSESIA
jgi:hypothetical protein